MTIELNLAKHFMANGYEISYYEGDTYLTALRRVGIEIPTLCYDPELKPSTSCRLCVIEIENQANLVTACSTTPVEGINVSTNSPKVMNAREVLIELILAQHPLKCTVCDKAGNCTLENLAYEYLSADKLDRFKGKLPETDLHEKNEFFTLDYSMCIRCGKCVQVVNEIQLCNVLSMERRGFDTYPSAGFGQTFREAGCVACGNCVAVCPVDALKPLTVIGAGREPQFERVQTTCVYCGVGCQLELVVHKRRNELIYVDSVTSHRPQVNGLAMCVKGRYGLDFVHHPERIDQPLIKQNGEFKVVTWQEAFDFIEHKFKKILREEGPDAFSILSSAKCTNEENYLMQKFARAGLNTNNVDHCPRLCHASTVTGLVRTFGSGAMTNSIDDLTNNAEVIFVIGSNTTEAHPVIGIKIKQAVAEGKTRLIVADPRKIELAHLSEIHLQQRPGTDIAIINAMLKVIVDENLVDEQFIRDRTEGYEDLVAKMKDVSIEAMARVAGIEVSDIIDAARLFAKAETAAIVYSMGITQHSTGTYNVVSLANLAMVTGNVGKPGTGVNPLRGQNNVQGACDLGALPNVFPGYQNVDIEENRLKFATAWGVDELSEIPGLTVVEMMHAAHAGDIKAMYIMGENPALSDPNVNKVREALANPDLFLVVQDLFLSETAKFADVVLPASSFVEKEGTFTNTERRVQRIRKAIEPIGDRKADWQILSELLNRFGIPSDYQSPDDILREINQVTPIYSGISPERLEPHGLQWPCRNLESPGTKILHTEKFATSSGLGKIYGVDFQDAAELPDEEYPFVLTTGRNLYHFHTGEMTHRSKGLHERRPYELTEINPLDAQTLGIEEGNSMRLTSRRGTLISKAKLTDKVKSGVIFMTFHHKEAAANLLTNDVLDPYAKIPELKVAAVRVEKVSEGLNIEEDKVVITN